VAVIVVTDLAQFAAHPHVTIESSMVRLSAIDSSETVSSGRLSRGSFNLYLDPCTVWRFWRCTHRPLGGLQGQGTYRQPFLAHLSGEGTAVTNLHAHEIEHHKVRVRCADCRNHFS